MFPASRWGRAGGTETQLVIAWGKGGFETGSESSFNYLFLPVMTQSGTQHPKALTKKVFTLHKPKLSPWKKQLNIWLIVNPDNTLRNWFHTNPESLLKHISLKWPNKSIPCQLTWGDFRLSGLKMDSYLWDSCLENRWWNLITLLQLYSSHNGLQCSYQDPRSAVGHKSEAQLKVMVIQIKLACFLGVCFQTRLMMCHMRFYWSHLPPLKGQGQSTGSGKSQSLYNMGIEVVCPIHW